VIWPDKTYQTLKNVKTNQALTIKANQVEKCLTTGNYTHRFAYFKVEAGLGIDFIHENDYIDFLVQN
jgi:hypothetical protein